MAMAKKSTGWKEKSIAAPAVAPDTGVIGMTTQIVSAFVSNHQMPVAEVPNLMRNVFAALTGIGNGMPAEGNGELKPAVSIKKSIGDDYIICLIDGKKLKMLKRYLKAQHNMTPEEYRKKFDLPHDYPMVAPAYARLRSAFAKKIGLGKVPVARGKRKPKVD